jgi:hypothetical protein
MKKSPTNISLMRIYGCVESLKELGYRPLFQEQLIEIIKESISNISTIPDEIDKIYYTVETLKMLNSYVDNPVILSSVISHQQNPDGGFGPFNNSYISATYRAVNVLTHLGPINRNFSNCTKWLKKQQHESGAFGDPLPNIIDTYYAIKIFYLLNSTPPNISKCLEWILKCQANEGGFKIFPEGNVTLKATALGLAANQLLVELLEERDGSPFILFILITTVVIGVSTVFIFLLHKRYFR